MDQIINQNLGIEACAEFLVNHSWGQKQKNRLDKKTNEIVYKLSKTFEQLQSYYSEIPEELHIYATFRWYSFVTHNLSLEAFLAHPRVTSEKKKNHKTIDLYIDGIPFDVKLTVFPKKFCFDQELLTSKPRQENLIQWYYTNQSKGNRYHTGNRLFLVCYDLLGTDHNSMKANTYLIANKVKNYLDNLDLSTLPTATVIDSKTGQRVHPMSDIIFITDEASPEDIPKSWASL